MKGYKWEILSLVIFITGCCLCYDVCAQEKITDTTYYNSEWKICEAPMAAYYRVGDLMLADSLLIFHGPFKDYTYDHRLLGSGVYVNGRKDGFFIFYYQNGVVHFSGRYSQDSLLGMWRWNYPGGQERATIYFPGIEQEFKFVTYRDEAGRTSLENGSGSFKWETSADNNFLSQQVRGSFEKGKRDSKWIYSYPNAASDFGNLYETYNREGVFIGGGGVSYRNNRVLKRPISFNFIQQRFLAFESMGIDNIFKMYGDDKMSFSLLKYLMYKKPISIDLQKIAPLNVFDTVMKLLLKMINTSPGYVAYNTSKIEFNISKNGSLENIAFTAFSRREEIYLEYVLEKIKNIQHYNPNPRLYEVYVNGMTIKNAPSHNDRRRTHAMRKIILSSLPKGQMDYVFKNQRLADKYEQQGYFIWQP